jgi:hypothetical protein
MARSKATSNNTPSPAATTPPAATGWRDPKELGVSEKAFFKAEDGKIRRIHIMAEPVMAHVQFVQGLGFVHSFCEYEEVNGTMLLKTPGLDMELMGKEPQRVWMMPVLVYDTDKKGVITAKDPSKIEYEFQLWTVYEPQYKRLFDFVREYGVEEFSQKDILVSGVKRGQYVNADLSIGAKDAVCLDPKIRAKVEAAFRGYQFRDTSRWIARTITEDELREALAKADTDGGGGQSVSSAMRR